MAKDFKLKPLDDRIIVKPSEAEETTSSGLAIPDTAKQTRDEREGTRGGQHDTTEGEGHRSSSGGR